MTLPARTTILFYTWLHREETVETATNIAERADALEENMSRELDWARNWLSSMSMRK